MKMKKIKLQILFSIFSLAVFAQEQPANPPAEYITEFPFKQLSGGVILIKACYNNLTDTFNFILDTGSGGISLDSLTVEEYKIPHVPSGRTINGIAGIREVDFAKNNTLSFPGLKVENLDFYINNYDILSSVYGVKIDGIIGYSFLRRYIVNIDFDSLLIKVYTPGTIEYERRGLLLHPLFTALPIQPLRIKDARSVLSNFYIDTGAGLCFLVSRRFQQDSLLLQKKRKPVAIQVHGLGGKKQMYLTIIKEVKIGPYRFRKVPTNILDDEYNATSYPFVGGLLGNDILRRFNITLNYPQKEIFLLPNRHFRDPFDYSYTGLSMYTVDGVIYVDDVITDSPAERSGLKKDDIVLGVNNNFSNDISVYKNLMQNVGEKITLVVQREQVPVIVSFRVGRIY
jgi:hypothetical protein